MDCIQVDRLALVMLQSENWTKQKYTLKLLVPVDQLATSLAISLQLLRDQL